MRTCALVLVLAVVYQLWKQSHLSIDAFGWKFLTSSTWDPVQEQYGALPYIFGTVFTAVMALVIALCILIALL